MIHVSSSVVQFRGSHYDFGVYQAQKLNNTAYFEKISVMYKRMRQKYVIDVPYVQAIFRDFAPPLNDEIRGLADALEIDLETAYLYFAGFYVNVPSGCSIMMDDHYMIRNYDNAPETYDGRFVLFAPTDGGYASVGPSMQITGRTDGMNVHGLVVGYNFVNTKHNGDGFVCNMIARIVLETCKNVQEAVALLKRIPHKHAFNYCLLDATGASIVVEASARDVITVDKLVCTNHFAALTNENRYRMDDSLAREKVLTAASNQKNMSYREAYATLNDPQYGVFATKYGAWDGTVHTTTFMPKSLMMTFTIGSNALSMPIDFRQWTLGTNFMYTKFKGQLDAKYPFITMQ